MALFFIILFLFIPLKFVFEVSADFENKSGGSKIRFFNIFMIYKKTLIIKQFSLCDKKGKKVEIFSKNKKFDLRRALYLSKLYFIFVYNSDSCFFEHVIKGLDYIVEEFTKNKIKIFAKKVPNHKIIACEGIFYTTFANIIIRIVFNLGEYLWTQLKIKLKRLLMD